MSYPPSSKSPNRADGSPRQKNVLGTVYLIHFDRPISEGHPCQHYLGWAENLPGRLRHHRAGTGSNLCRVANDLGIGYSVVRVWTNVDRNFERKLKNMHNAPCKCPICKAERQGKRARLGHTLERDALKEWRKARREASNG